MFEFDIAEIPRQVEFAPHRLTKIRLTLKPVAECQKTLGDLSDLSSNLLYANRDLAQFLDIATSQEVFFRV